VDWHVTIKWQAAFRERRDGIRSGYRSIWGLAATLALSACASTGAVDGVPPAAPPPAAPEEVNAFDACRQRAKVNEVLVDTASRRLLQTVCGASLWFDSLFGERDLAAAEASYGHVEVSGYYSQFRGMTQRVRFIIHTKLPAMNHRLSAFVGRDDDEDFVRDRTEGYALRTQAQPTDHDEFLAGLGFRSVTTETFRSEFKVGARNPTLPKVFVQNRFSWTAYSNSQNRVQTHITPFWTNRDGFGVTPSVDFDRVIEDDFLLRWGNTATITEKSPGLSWRTAAILYQNLTGVSALAYEVFVRGATGAREPIGEYGVRTVYRRPLYHARLFGNLVLGYSWPRDDPALQRKGSADIGLGLEMPFGIEPK
jgi:hypothetical protein